MQENRIKTNERLTTAYNQIKSTTSIQVTNLFARHQCTLDLGAADAVSRDVEHVVHTPVATGDS